MINKTSSVVNISPKVNTQTYPPIAGPAQPTAKTNDYAALKQLIKEQGLMERQPSYTIFQLIFITGLFVAGLVGFSILNTVWLVPISAAYFAFVFVQLGFIAHDVGHRQVYKEGWKNDLIGFTVGNLILGMSYGWWVYKHNIHHSHPNELDLDPDLNIPVLAFSEEQALEKRGILRLLAKYQAYLFFPMLMLVSFSIKGGSLRYIIIWRQAKRPVLELSLMGIHTVLYFGLLFYWLGMWPALLFIVIHQALFGLYMGSVFAPNHKGMPTLAEHHELDFLRQQVVTARNVIASPLIDFWYGGLNYQIEHHLFPNMPRNKLRHSQAIVKAFCQNHAITYYETGVVQSYREIVQNLHAISAPLRAKGES